MESQRFTVPDYAARYRVSQKTILERISQNVLQTITINGILYVWDRWADPATGTNTAEDFYLLRGVEVAEILNITTRNLRYLVRDGKIACVWARHQRRYSLADIRRYIASREEAKHGNPVKRNAVRAGIVKWALERLATMDHVKVYDPTVAKEYHRSKG